MCSVDVPVCFQSVSSSSEILDSIYDEWFKVNRDARATLALSRLIMLTLIEEGEKFEVVAVTPSNFVLMSRRSVELAPL